MILFLPFLDSASAARGVADEFDGLLSEMDSVRKRIHSLVSETRTALEGANHRAFEPGTCLCHPALKIFGKPLYPDGCHSLTLKDTRV